MELRLAAVNLNQTPLAWRQNRAHIEAGLEIARGSGASLICFPELCISGYGAEDAFLWPGTAERSLDELLQLAPASRDLVAAVGLPLRVGDTLHNAVALLVDGAIVGFACKRHLAGDGLHYEPRWFEPWSKGRVERVQLPSGMSIPVGDLLFDIGGVRVGFEICEDAWVDERPGYELMKNGVDVILNPSASHFAFRKHEYRRRLVETGSREFGVAYVYANLIGNEAGRSIYDGDSFIAQGGEIVATARRFVFSDTSVTVADVTLPSRKSWAANTPADAARMTTSATFTWPSIMPPPSSSPSIRLEGALSKEVAFAKAIALGLFDYARKSKSRGFVLSLSGGADSAACAVLVRYMISLAVEGRGLTDAAMALGYPEARNEAELVRSSLVTVYQATENSGQVTRRAAAELAAALGTEHHELELGPIVRGYVELVEEAIGRGLDWERDDIALQNIQARVRAPSVWMMANLRGALLLSTSNRSEAAVGYATMDGDTAGGLAPIAGIDKAYLRLWLKWMEVEGPPGFGPLHALGAINDQAPTAELRPLQHAQTDEADLMPYEILNAAEAAFVVERKGPLGVLASLTVRFPQFSQAELALWVSRFFRLFSRNQWKRERYAPSFHVDDRSLDPKTWCRFPILSGGFEEELFEIQDLLKES